MPSGKLEGMLQSLNDVAQLTPTLEAARTASLSLASAPTEVKNKALAVGIPGVYADQTSVRTYPAGQVAGSIVGYVGPDGKAREGLELTI